MARSPRRWWDWLVLEHQLSPPEDSWVTTHECPMCGRWLVQQSIIDTAAVRLNAAGREPTDVVVVAPDPDRAWYEWSTQRTPVLVRCPCGTTRDLCDRPSM